MLWHTKRFRFTGQVVKAEADNFRRATADARIPAGHPMFRYLALATVLRRHDGIVSGDRFPM